MKQNVGGQAVIEGVLMRGPKIIATAVRKQNGEIVYRKKEISNMNNKMFKMPFLRGIIGLYDAMVVGIKELIFSANESGEDEEELTNSQISMSVIFSLFISITVFMLIPSMVGTFIFPLNKGYSNLVEALIRIILFISYIYMMTKNKELKRVFEYHGAEHKAINNYEMGTELNISNSKNVTRFHKRCGTSFLFIVMIISIFVFSFVDIIFTVPTNKFYLILYKLTTRVIFVPIIASISYEIQRLASKYDNIFSDIVSKPGILLQNLTTSEPDEEQLEVAIVALNVALGNDVTNAREIKYE